MYAINRAIVIIKKKQPFLDWLKQLPDPEMNMTLAEINSSEPCCYLIPVSESNEVQLKHLKTYSKDIFEDQMGGYWTDEDDWENDLSWANFKKWFDFEISTLPFDCVDEDIQRDD